MKMVATAEIKITKKTVRKILSLVDKGLCSGRGAPKPGEMCVEAVVCYALGLPHGDEPPCVSAAVRSFKIALNDSCWSSNQARAKGLRRLSVAQLGSNIIDEQIFIKVLVEGVISKIVPIALRAAASVHPEEKHQTAMLDAAKRCEVEKDKTAADAAANAAANAAAYAAAYAAADAAANAAYAAANAAAYSAAYAADAAAYAAAYAADAAANAAYAAYAAYAADAAANAAYAAYAAYAANAAARNEILSIVAEIGIDALKAAGAPGIKYLELCEEAAQQKRKQHGS